METVAAAVPDRIPAKRRGLSAFFLSLIPPLLFFSLGGGWALVTGGAVTAWAAWRLVQAVVHPRVNLGKRWSVLGLLIAGATTYAAIGEVAQEVVWRRAFQLTPQLSLFRDEVNGWSVLYPALWGHREQRSGGTVSHVFLPSKMTPAMSFTVASRSNVGTQDLSLIVENFFMNLPKGGGTDILEREPVTLPSGRSGYRVVYSELSRRIPLKNEVLFVLEKDRLYFLSVQATPRWFDRHRVYLEKVLYSLAFAAA